MRYIFNFLNLLLIVIYSIVIGFGLSGLIFQTSETGNSLFMICLGFFPLMISILKSRSKNTKH